MQIDDLRYFANIARSGSFARGAALSNISPPAASKAVRRLELEFGVPLFTRTTRRVTLTSAGVGLMQTSQRIFDELVAFADEVSAGGSSIKGDVRIAAMEVFSVQVLPKVISELCGEFPDLRPRTFEMPPHRMEELIRHGRLDVGFTIGGGGVRGLEYHTLGTSKGVLVCGRQHPLYKSGRVFATRLHEYPFVVPEFMGMEHLPTLDQFPDNHYGRKVGVTIELLQMGVQLAIEGRHLGYFPEVSVRAHLKSGSLKALGGIKHHATFELRAITSVDRTPKPAVELLIGRLKRAIAGKRG